MTKEQQQDRCQNCNGPKGKWFKTCWSCYSRSKQIQKEKQEQKNKKEQTKTSFTKDSQQLKQPTNSNKQSIIIPLNTPEKTSHSSAVQSSPQQLVSPIVTSSLYIGQINFLPTWCPNKSLNFIPLNINSSELPILSNLDRNNHLTIQRLKLRYQPKNFNQMIRKDVIKIMTYNVWNDAHNIQKRFEWILAMIAQSEADIICLQQIQHFKEWIYKYSQFFPQYFIPEVKNNKTMLLSKIPGKFYQAYPNQQEHKTISLIYFQLQNSNKQKFTLAISSVHLKKSIGQMKEDQPNVLIRLEQLKNIEYINKDVDVTIVAGDMNFRDNSYEEHVMELKNYKDLQKMQSQTPWEEWTLKSKWLGAPGLWRIDRIFFRDNKNKIKKQIQTDVKRFGQQAIDPYKNYTQFKKAIQTNMIYTPSDHLGLLATLTFK